MRRFVCSFVLVTAIACFASTAYAQQVRVVDFAQFNTAPNSTWGFGFPTNHPAVTSVTETNSDWLDDQETVTYTDNGVSFRVNYGMSSDW